MTRASGGLVSFGLIVLVFAGLGLAAINIIKPSLPALSSSFVDTNAALTDAELLELYPMPTEPLVMEYTRISTHGITKHPEAAELEASCNKSIFQIWRDKYERKYYYLCKLAGDKWGIIPVIVVGAEEIWKTGFSPGGGTWTEVLRYLINTATRFTGKVQ